MSIKYKFKGTDVSNIIQYISENNYISSYYTGFPNSTPAEYQIDRPLALLYSIQGVDISNNCSVNTYTFKNSINGAGIPTNAKYISAICVGGGGGGGGAGGAGYDGFGKENQGGNGGNGAPGAYCAIIQYSCVGSNTYNVVVGAGGKGGGGGSEHGTNTAGKGAKGGDGTDGGYSSLTIDTTIIDASGGNSGFGGNGGGENNDGDQGGSGTTPFGVIDPSNIIVAGETLTISSLYPPQTGGSGGNYGNGGKGNGNAGGPGTPGYVRVNFLYD